MKKHLIIPLLIFLLCSCNNSTNPSISESFSDTESMVIESDSLSESESDEIETDSESFEDTESESLSESESEKDERETYDLNIYDGYYSDLTSWENGEDLKNQLNVIINKNYTPMKYEGNWESNRLADRCLDNFQYVDVLYSDTNRSISNTYYNGSGWQREHAFPATLMTGQTTSVATQTRGMATDFHNLFASFETANNSRGNKDFGIVGKTGEEVFSVEGSDGVKYDSKTFEPSNKDKGQVARAIFYMATMYPTLQVSEQSGGTGSKKHGNLSDLLTWNNSIEVSRSEYQHNLSVYKDVVNGAAQGNRNPYVDYPGLVDYVYGDKQNEAGELKYIKPTFISLEMDKDVISNYAASSYKEVYDKNTNLNFDDFKIVGIKNDFTVVEDNILWTMKDYQDGHLFENPGDFNLEILTDINKIVLPIKVNDDPINVATYSHKLSAKSTGQDFYGINTKASETHTLNLSGLDWNVTWNKGEVSSNSANGVKFGTNSKPIERITFTTKNNFVFNNKNLIKNIYVEGMSSSGSTFKVDFKVNDTLIGTYDFVYNGGVCKIYGVSLDEPIEGKVSIILYNINKSVYINRIAINAM